MSEYSLWNWFKLFTEMWGKHHTKGMIIKGERKNCSVIISHLCRYIWFCNTKRKLECISGDRKLLPIWDSIQNTYWWSSLYVLCLAGFEYGTAGKRTPMFRYLFVQHVWGVGNQQGNCELNWELWDFKLSCAFEDCDCKCVY